MKRTRSKALIGFAAASLLAIAAATPVWSHGSEARDVEVIPWQKENITRSLGLGRSLGLRFRNAIEMKTVGGKSCAVGTILAFDVNDSFAFDIDEPVELTLTYAPALSAPFVVAWDKNAGEGRGLSDEIALEPGVALRKVTVTLDRARLAGRGTLGTDIAVGSREGVCLCDIELSRSGETRQTDAFGRLNLDVRDKSSDRTVPARVGLYDATGRAPLPSEQALLVHRFADEVRMLWVSPRAFWPSDNRQAFYVDGSYESRLPAGTYDLVVTRGPEYRAHRGKVEIREGETSHITVALERYADLPSRGWISGDAHIHLQRAEAEDRAIWGQVAAEDVHVANLLQMGNIAGTHFAQPEEWG